MKEKEKEQDPQQEKEKVNTHWSLGDTLSRLYCCDMIIEKYYSPLSVSILRTAWHCPALLKVSSLLPVARDLPMI